MFACALTRVSWHTSRASSESPRVLLSKAYKLVSHRPTNELNARASPFCDRATSSASVNVCNERALGKTLLRPVDETDSWPISFTRASAPGRSAPLGGNRSPKGARNKSLGPREIRPLRPRPRRPGEYRAPARPVAKFAIYALEHHALAAAHPRPAGSA